MRYIGDIHAQYGQYLAIIESCEESRQVGDFGIGFQQNPIDLYDVEKHKFIRGNHDNPFACSYEPNWIADGTVENDVMYIGGASSIDKDNRIEGVNWWREEELTYSDFMKVTNIYEISRPRILVTHDCPDFLPSYLKSNVFKETSITRQALQEMREIHKPEIHIFGHWHLDFDKVIDGTRFICLGINSYIDL